MPDNLFKEFHEDDTIGWRMWRVKRFKELRADSQDNQEILRLSLRITEENDKLILLLDKWKSP